jgi:hypothetical protein
MLDALSRLGITRHCCCLAHKRLGRQVGRPVSQAIRCLRPKSAPGTTVKAVQGFGFQRESNPRQIVYETIALPD